MVTTRKQGVNEPLPPPLFGLGWSSDLSVLPIQILPFGKYFFSVMRARLNHEMRPRDSSPSSSLSRS